MNSTDGPTIDQGLPALAVAPIGEAKSSGLAGIGRSGGPAADRSASAPGQVDAATVDRPRQLRIGDKVRSLVDDVCVSIGLTGLVVNVAPPRYGAPVRARILWDNETVSMADADTFEMDDDRPTAQETARAKVA
jgi:hypothetical protein